jgi:hypothetical protein
MYSLNMPVAALRTKMRQEFERHRYVNQIGVVDMLIFQSHAEYQVGGVLFLCSWVGHGDGAVLGTGMWSPVRIRTLGDYERSCVERATCWPPRKNYG